MSDTLYLDPDLFMALGMSAEDFGGIGILQEWNLADGTPMCIIGHSWSCTRAIPESGECGYSILLESASRLTWAERNDTRLIGAGVEIGDRVPFAEWCRVVGVDVKS